MAVQEIQMAVAEITMMIMIDCRLSGQMDTNPVVSEKAATLNEIFVVAVVAVYYEVEVEVEVIH
jgi:hypothetical protein